MKMYSLLRLFNRQLQLCRRYTSLAKNENLSYLHERIFNINFISRMSTNSNAERKSGLRLRVQVLGNGNDGSARAVLLLDNHQSYLFNCGEGLLRFALEHRVKFGRVKNFFVTYNSWQNVAGLPTVFLSLSKTITASRTLHGPPNVENLFAMTERFVNLENMKVLKRECSKPPFESSGVKIEYVPLFGSKQLDGKRDVSVAYICKFDATSRKLDIEKCVDYGVPAGPLLKVLKNGCDVTLPDGSIVRSEDVCSSRHGAKSIIIVECPSKNFLEPLLDAEEFRTYQHSSQPISSMCDVIVHFTPEHMMKLTKYQRWMKRFPKTVTHLVVNDSCPGQTSEGIYHFQDELRLLHEGIFPSLPVEQKQFSLPGIDNIVVGEPLLLYHLQSDTPGVDRSKVLSVSSEDNEEMKMNIQSNQVVDILQKLKSTPLYKSVITSSKDASYPEVVFLGTSSTQSTTFRNCISTLIHLRSASGLSGIFCYLCYLESKAVILDCGEGTFSQMVRMYGYKEAKHILRNLTAIFVSHMHADHHLGLLTLLLERQKAFQELQPPAKLKPLYLVYSKKILYWLRTFHSTFEPILDSFKLVDFDELLHNRRTMEDKLYLRLLWDIGLKDISAEHVIHFGGPYGMILTHRNGCKIVYSGDTMPCDKLIEAGKDCDVLLHEATMEEDMIDEAREKRHSTTNEAIEVGQKMGAKLTILTHISSRYRKIPLFTEKFTATVGVAFDFMKVNRETLPLIPQFVACLKAMYSESYEKLAEKSERRHILWEQTTERRRRKSTQQQ